MKEKWKRLSEKLSTYYHKAQNKKIQKSARITYGVLWNLLLIFLVVLVMGFSFAGGVGAGYFASLVHKEPIRSYAEMKKNIYNYEETSNLYFANDVYLGKLRSDLEREEVSIKDVSPYLKDAIVATEDQYFYEHHGVVPKSIFRALFQEFTNSSVQTGGSTLTQQLIKNQILTNEVSFERKAKEILLALRLEKFFKKDEILEAYLNVSTFGRNSSGRNIAGVQSAAKGLFGVEAKDLNLPQSAFIAGLPQSPFGYTPFTNQGKLKDKEGLQPGLDRMKIVLQRMHDNGFISDKEYQSASNYDIVKDFIPSKPSVLEKYPYLTFEIEDRASDVMAGILAKKDGYTEEDLKKDKELKGKYKTLAGRNLRQNGYQIHTTINKDIYDKMQKAKDQYDSYGPTLKDTVKDPDTGENIKKPAPVQVGAILIENETGKILSFVGGRDFNIEQVNHATQSRRSTGSTIKPLAVYGPAMELGKSAPGAIIPDVEMYLNPQDPGNAWPHNYNASKFSGLVSARYALAKSLNVPAVKTYESILDQQPAHFLDKMGFSSLTKTDYYIPSLALGGLTNGVTVEENVNAFATFANGGQFVDAYLIDKITDKDGNTVYQHESTPVDVFSPQTSYLMIDMMRDVLKYGTAASVPYRLKFSTDWAGKTGTSQDQKDSWFIATNPKVTFGTWTGYDTPRDLKKALNGIGGPTYSLRNLGIWEALMNSAYEAAPEEIAPKERFKMPGGIVSRSYCAVSGMLPSEACSKAGLVETDIFNAKYVPNEKDDSLVDGKYVQAGGKKYLALPTTPSEFSSSGLILNPDFVKEITGGKMVSPDARQLIPNNSSWNKILVADDKMEDDGAIPSPVSASASGSTVAWSPSSSKDVIGYRVYRITGGNAMQRAASVHAGGSLSTSVSSGRYVVAAVDIAGNESIESNTVTIGGASPSKPEKPDKPEKPGKPDKPEKPDKPADGDGGTEPGGSDTETGTTPPPDSTTP
ncbi:transglycosylase domain-containing protein [Falsibacillus pallidus]|uniref:Penicillin-binding protein n=1 Tax=Falsibacillus pallidus TaxID=493781 RepID=A0A370GKL7_9BACI|nr:transglycosylase domain-containing protein [Falsibacillus pallidus]RDI44298.1 penicillin-binding protein [Falsibacillus pallidus]